MRTRHRLFLVLLGTWALAPIAMLALRALVPSWHYPDILPNSATPWSGLSPAAGSRVLSALVTSMWVALATAVTATTIGFVAARNMARMNTVPQRLTLAAAFFAVVAPPLGLGVGLQVVLLSLGLGGTLGGVFLAHLVPATGYLTLFAAGIFTSVDLSIEDEARTLGASRWQVWSRVLVPLLRRRLAEGLVLAALVSWGQLAITLLVGGGVVRTLPVELLSIIQAGNDQVGALAALALSVPPMLAIGLLAAGVQRTGASL